MLDLSYNTPANDANANTRLRVQEFKLVTAEGEITSIATPLGLIAELTHRCPLGCPYCSNPQALDKPEDELDTATWARVFIEAAALGARQVDLSGGEPGARRDLVEIAASAREAGLYTRLVTSGIGITTRTMRDLWEAGLDHVQVSFQDADAVSADHIAGHKGAFQRKYALATEAVRLGLRLTINVVIHRANIDRISGAVDLALALKASRIEIAHVQYYGWALRNREALMPTQAQAERAPAAIEELRRRHQGRIVIDTAASADCRGQYGRAIYVTPSGKVLPCLAAESIPDLESWNVRDRSLEEIWALSPAFCACRGAACPADRPRIRRSHNSADQKAEIHADEPYHYRR